MQRYQNSGEVFRVPASFERDHNGNERSRVAFPGCIPLELAIKLRGDGMFVEPDYYDAEKWKNNFDQGYEQWEKRMLQDEEAIRKTKEEHERKLKEEAERLEQVRKAKEEESRLLLQQKSLSVTASSNELKQTLSSRGTVSSSSRGGSTVAV